jgi:16S rRNA (cytosine967-C5)-methyltransferase
MRVSPARSAAFEILVRIDKTDAYASELLHATRFAKLSAQDHALLTELVMGVLRWRSVLDEKIDGLSRSDPSVLPKSGRSGAPPVHVKSRKIARFDLEVLTALRLGVYQLLFLDRVPRHAAVNESVELVKRAHKGSAAGLVNAVLRKIQPTNSEPDYHSAHSEWMIERWKGIYGPEVTRKICEHNQSPPETALRTNASLEQLNSEGIRLEPARLLTKAAVVTGGDLSRTPSFRQHRLTIQDEASQLVALLVGTGKSILDCCAAPGGKTRILAERNPDAHVVALELHPHRAALLRKLVREPNIQIVVADARQMPLAKHFDRVLVDAPCSGTGTLGRNPEIKWRLRPDDITRLQKYQIAILSSAMNLVASGGKIVYSTCSLETEENQQVIQHALSINSSFQLRDCREELQLLKEQSELSWNDIDSILEGPYLRTIPGVHPSDGFFAAILERQ